MSGRKITRGMDYTHFSEVANVCLFTDIAMLMFFSSKRHSNERWTTNPSLRNCCRLINLNAEEHTAKKSHSGLLRVQNTFKKQGNNSNGKGT